MADRTIEVHDNLTDEDVQILVIDNGDDTFSQAIGSAAEGKVNDAAVTGDTPGTISGKLRGLLKTLAAVFDSGNNVLKTSSSGSSGSSSNPNYLNQRKDNVASYRGTDMVMHEGIPVYPAPIVANIAQSQTDSQLVQRYSGKRIRVLQVVAQTGANQTNLTFNSKANGIAGTAITPAFQNAPNSGEVLPFNEHGWFETNLNEALTVTTGAGATTGILLKYILIP